ncbi:MULTISPECIES: nickel-responsive transcriptional regulator NikR [unclassified Helicobacter]|uniref:nickel-responsive transcriptional regulator NikR n=1 Tax=unclassified Helicobacter TaxID=2593540 RepID=UPI000CF0E2E7|nr:MULTISPECIES: nickel-responsive transcriptional regulator NikR [unclassified Helicobacter]
MDLKNEVIRFSVSLQKKLLDELDNRLTKQGYVSRSELVRDLIREKIIEREWEDEDSEQIAVLVLIYDHHTKELSQKMIEMQHENYNVKVLCSTHIHLDTCNCLETIVFKGKSGDIVRTSIEIGGLRGVKFSKLTKATNFTQNV